MVWAFTSFFGLGANVGVSGVARELWEEFRSSATEASEIGRELAPLAFEVAPVSVRVTRLSVEQLSEVLLPWLPQELARVCGDWIDELGR